MAIIGYARPRLTDWKETGRRRRVTVSIAKAKGQDAEGTGRPSMRSEGRESDTTDIVAYKQLAQHLSMPYMELEWASELAMQDVSAMVVVWCNQAMASYVGVLSPDDVAGRPVREVTPLLLPDLRLANEQGLWCSDALGRRGPLVDRSEQGVVAFGIRDPAAPHGCRVGVLVEQAALRHQAVEALARRARELAALHETLLQLNAQTDLHDLLATIVARAAGLLDAPRGGVYLARDDGELLELAVSHGAPGAYVETRLQLGEGVSGRAAAEGRAVLVGAERSWRDRDRAYPDAPIGPAVAVPLRLDGAVIGALYVGDDDRESAFDHSDARLLSMFADQATLVIQRTRLLEQAQRDAEQRAVLLREVNHRVKNNLTAIIGLLYAQGRAVPPEYHEAYQQILTALAARIQALATAHELLSRTRWGPVSFQDLASQVMGSVLGSAGTDVSWRVRSSDVALASEPAQNVAMVLSELASNVLEHATQGRVSVACEVTCARTEESAGPGIIVTFRDNGIGYPSEVIAGQSEGLGLELVRNLAHHSLGGALRLYNEGGAVARIELPAPWLDEETL
jgi:two-component sensor histidine kinase